MNTKLFSAVELEILEALQKGVADSEIIAQFNLTKRALNNHLKNIRGKLHVHSRSHAVDRAIAMGLLKALTSESELKLLKKRNCTNTWRSQNGFKPT